MEGLTRWREGTPAKFSPERSRFAQSSGEWPGARMTFLRGLALEDGESVDVVSDDVCGGRKDDGGDIRDDVFIRDC